VPDDAEVTAAGLEQRGRRLGQQRSAAEERRRRLGEGNVNVPVKPECGSAVREKVSDVPEIREVAEVGEAEKTRDEDDVVWSSHAVRLPRCVMDRAKKGVRLEALPFVVPTHPAGGGAAGPRTAERTRGTAKCRRSG
jgi:hypothetical protein